MRSKTWWLLLALYCAQAFGCGTADEASPSSPATATQSLCSELPLVIEAESFSAASAGSGISAQGPRIIGLNTGEWVRFDGLDLSSVSSVAVSYGTPYGPQAFELRADSATGPLLSSFTAAATGDWTVHQLVTAQISAQAGTHDVYLVGVRSVGDWVAAFDFIQLDRQCSGVCGDGILDVGEQCDGSAGLLDPEIQRCDSLCALVAQCGNGFLEGLETCDDGNTTDGDGCSASCSLESTPGQTLEVEAGTFTGEARSFGMLMTAPGQTVCWSNVNLSGVTSLELVYSNGEAADALAVTLDGADLTMLPVPTCRAWDADCPTNAQSTLADPHARGQLCLRGIGLSGVFVAALDKLLLNGGVDHPACGNGIAEVGEACDDGNRILESCAYGQLTCSVCGPSCSNVPGLTSFCGDGGVDAQHGEACDDGNAVSGDGCDASCRIEQPDCTVDAQCDDGLSCTSDSCEHGSCVHVESSECAWSCNMPQNLVKNCNFNQGLTGYAGAQGELVFFEGAAGTQNVVGGELVVTTRNGGSADWHVQPRQEKLILSANQTYEVKFRARAEAPRQITISITENADPWTAYAGMHTFTLGTSMRTYSFLFTMPAQGSGNAKFEVQAGGTGGALPTFVMDDWYVAPRTITRPSNAHCLAGDSPASVVATQTYWAGVVFNQPLAVVEEPPASGTDFFVVEKEGTVRRLLNDANDAGNRVFFRMPNLHTLEESGMADLVFDPNYGDGPSNNRYLYLSYVAAGAPHQLRLSRLAANADGTSVDLASEKILFSFPQSSNIHKGGALLFGPGPVAGVSYLYMSVGDDGNNTVQDPNPLKVTDPNQPHGKVFRLTPEEYRSTAAGPLAWSAARIVATGLRNPWRMSFDGNDLWIGNVGFDKIEEVNKLNVLTDVGINFGWPWCEGNICCGDANEPWPCAMPGLPPRPAALAAPEYSYPRSDGPSGQSAVIGGFVYRGTQLPGLVGKYVFSDFADGVIYAYDPVSKQREQILPGAGMVDGFGQDHDGELYFIDFAAGKVQRLVSGNTGPSHWPPQNLSDWGCFTSLNHGDPIPAQGVFRYEVAQRFWSDGATKERFVALPDRAFINVEDANHWELPPGAVTIKNFYWHGQIFETRLLVRHDSGVYAGYTYQWTSPDTATLVPSDGETRQLDGITWQYPSRAQCLTCHTQSAGRSLSLESRQLNLGSQITQMADMGLFSPAQPALLEPFPLVPTDPNGYPLEVSDAQLEKMALSYLHVNCSSCHRGQATWDARFETSFASKGLCDVIPTVPVTPFGSEERLVKPASTLASGALAHQYSTLWFRMSSRDDPTLPGNQAPHQMPPLGSQRVDEAGAALLAQWLDSRNMCPAP